MPATRYDLLLKSGILFLIILGFMTTFIAGVYYQQLSVTPAPISVNTSPTPAASLPVQPIDLLPTTATEGYLSENDHTIHALGKHFFRDTLIVVTKDEPRRSVLVTMTRTEQTTNFFQHTAGSYFDGEKWVRQKAERENSDPRIEPDAIVKQWNSRIDPSRVLKQQITADFSLSNVPVHIETEILENEISMRSLPGYTKFMSHGKGVMLVDGQQQESYVLLTRIYSVNDKNIQFYDQPIGLTTDWLAFWDEQDNFYHVDATQVERPTPLYQSHQIAAFVSADKSTVQKTFSIGIQRTPAQVPTQYTFTFPAPVLKTLNIQTLNSFAKEPETGYEWYAGNVEGTVTNQAGETLHGVGVIEYIHDNK